MISDPTTSRPTCPVDPSPRVAEEVMLEVEVQGGGVLLSNDRKHYLLTLGVATCTAVIVWVPGLEAAMMFHESPNLGPRVHGALARFAATLQQVHPEFDPGRTAVSFHLEPGPLALAGMSAAERAARIGMLTEQVRTYFPAAEPLPLAQVTSRLDPNERSVSLVFDRTTGRLGRYSTWGDAIDAPPLQDFRELALPARGV